MVQRSYTCYTVKESTLRQSKRTSAPLHLISSLLGSCHTKKTGFQSVKSLCTLVFSKCRSMAVNFLLYRNCNNHADFRECQKHKSELSLKALIMRLYNTKSVKMVHFLISGVAESQQKCGVDDNCNDNLTFFII